jgi:hypothetical protein
MARYIVKIEPLATMGPDQVAADIAPVFQHYLTGALSEIESPTSRSTDTL